MADKIALGIVCEICGTDSWWDNRLGKKNPKAPDYKCGNRDCKDTSGYPCGRWEKNRSSWGKTVATTQSGTPVTRGPVPNDAPKGGRLTGDDTTPDEKGERVFTYEALCYTYGILLRKTVEAFEKAKVPVDPNAVQAAVATLLIQGEKGRIPLLHPRKPTPEPVAAPVKVEKPKKEFPPADDGEWERMDDPAPLPF